ncbi:MAG: formylmethanofuran dehydrogenase subunit C [Pirellulaceae bacterium]
MTALMLEQCAQTTQRLDMAHLSPKILGQASIGAIQRMPLQLGREQVQVGEIFNVIPTKGDRHIIRPCADNLDRLGAGMDAGELIVEGNAGHYLGAQMTGGRLCVLGRAGDFAASALSEGLVDIEGDCGSGLGAPPPGHMHGMSGGFVRIRGNCGPRAGERQRRGIILLEGDAGPEAGAGMIAGTLIVLGSTERDPGREMRRGTLLFEQMPASLPLTFNDNGVQPLGFLAILRGELERLKSLPQSWREKGVFARRFVGDLACAGKGEVLVWA